jgi:hypothetical protein
MSSRVLIPFDNNPVAVSVKTASYTIPTGRFARILINLEGSATFTIGGVTAIRGTQNSVLASDNLRTNTSLSNILVTTTDTNPTTTGAAFTETTDQKTVIAELWLPSGTVINGTGTWRAVVMEYNAIS